MKKIISEFFRRGLIASGFGPIVLAILYLILQHKTGLENLTVTEVCLGIFSLLILAFIAGGMNVVYKIEHLPLMLAILIHGGVLYITYLATYLVNNWLEWSKTPILVFSAIFVFSYFVIWSIIYLTIRRNTEKVNEVLKKKQEDVTHS